MKTSNNAMIFLLSLLIITLALNLAHAQDTEQWEEQETTLVGRISHIEGQLARYHPDTDDWEVTTMEAPFGLDDLLYAESDVKAEFIMPNNTWIRIGGDTRLQLVNLKPKTTEVDIAFGIARLYNKSAKTQIKATTPFGHIMAPPGSTVDLFVNENGVKIVAISKKAIFIHNSSPAKHEIRSDSSAMLADLDKVSAAPDKVELGWIKWNQDRDTLWATRMRDRGPSVAHLPTELHTEAYPLDQHGVWENVYYEGAYYRFWRPIHVGAHWAPFTSGTWTVWHGEHVWVPHESFGYVTHHYGNWIFTAGLWYWAPPVTRVRLHVHAPHLRIGFGWYPGRVAWIYHGANLGWIPLAPYEPYYTHRHWGRRSIVVTKGIRHHHNAHKYRHHKHAVVIHRSHLYRSGSYRHAKIRNVSHNTIRNKFRTTPVLNRAVIKDQGTLRSAKNRFRPAHKAQLSGHSVNSRNIRKKGRQSQAIPRQGRKSPHKKRSVQNQESVFHTRSRSLDGNQRLSAPSKPNVSKAYSKTKPNKRTTSKVHHDRPGGQLSQPRMSPQHRKRQNGKRNVDTGPSKTHQQGLSSGRIGVDRKHKPPTGSGTLRKNRVNGKRHNDQNMNRPPRRESMRMNVSRSRNIQHERNSDRFQKNGRSQVQQRNSRYASAPTNKKDVRHERAANPPKSAGYRRSETYRSPPAASRVERSVRRFEKQSPSVHRRTRQQNYQSQGRSNGSFSGTRHRPSASGVGRHRNRN